MFVRVGNDRGGIALPYVRDVDALERRNREPLHSRAARARGPHERREPAGKGFRVLEVGELAERDAERFLGGVGCAVPVARAGNGHADREVLEAGHELGPRTVVAVLRGDDDGPQAQVSRHRAHHNLKEPVPPAMVTVGPA